MSLKLAAAISHVSTANAERNVSAMTNWSPCLVAVLAPYPRSARAKWKAVLGPGIKLTPPPTSKMLPLSNFPKTARHFRATMTAHLLKLGPGYAASLFSALSTSAEGL